MTEGRLLCAINKDYLLANMGALESPGYHLHYLQHYKDSSGTRHCQDTKRPLPVILNGSRGEEGNLDGPTACNLVSILRMLRDLSKGVALNNL